MNTATMNVESRDADLIEALRLGMPDSWRELLALVQPLAERLARKAGLWSEADDLASEVVETVIAKLDAIDVGREGTTFKGFLWQIARNKIGDRIRARKVRQVFPLDLSRDSETVKPDTYADERHDAMSAALAVLRTEVSPAHWAAFAAVAIEGRDVAETAAEMGLSRANVDKIRSRIVARLREMLAG